MAHTPKQDGDDNDDSCLVASREQLESFQEDVQYLWCPSNIPIYDEPPSAFDFLRNHVSVSRPCIIRNSIITPETNDDNDNVLVPLILTLDDLVERFPDTTTTTTSSSDDDDDKASSSSLQLPLLHVDVTPDGHGDCLRKVRVNATVGKDDDDDHDNPCESNVIKEEEKKVFVKPLEREMTLAAFRHHLRQGRDKQQRQQQQKKKKGVDISDRIFLEINNSLQQTTIDDDDDHHQVLEDCVLYYSRQNDCLREELSPLWNSKVWKKSSSLKSSENDYLFPRSFPWAEEAFFGGQEEEQKQTSNNAVTTGGPDAVNLWMGDERVVSSMHKDHYENLFMYSVKYSKVHWIATDLFGKDKKKCDDDDDEEEVEEFPLSKYAHPITVKVKAGELLYLPSLWFHRVTQTCETIGINYWYDMNFESPMWCYFHFLQQLQHQKQQQQNDPK
ncbi:hypothetical protein FRACYDRAFT_246102 [Fragilariopsis cylindrus CCMP1102]|uniref:JmjC domain-containing protein n=1 Tax=Fragilariopsis cylindrus CCMP1102 TaxID=635003 RepID=A0A1E7EYF5_9STRA|nr:hypothetical protein FRACYDRAFT_246102 [Fragilariopsis cylindrus CCMP1102]|eukprot:OEU11001.1 hypothetical protein FRACYDRAFT_246102 [Fragilariopsis cylindrus CCMP1102]